MSKLALSKTCKVGETVFTAPDGWKFQDCEKKLVSMMRVKDKGDWTMDLQDPDDDTIPKDDYLAANPFKAAGREGIDTGAWEITTYDSVGGHSGHNIHARKRTVAIKELICLAEMTETIESLRNKIGFTEAANKASDKLAKCRNKHGIRLSSLW